MIKFTCEICKKEFTKKKYLNRHNKICKTKKIVYDIESDTFLDINGTVFRLCPGSESESE
jgi:hypothetical protein